MTIFPWQISHWRALQRRKSDHTLPHALLFVGPKGVGKYQFAITFAQSLLCLTPNDDQIACGQCRNCQLIRAGNHPDFIEILPEESGKAIKIDQIREMIETINKTPQCASNQIVIINPADALNMNAANALLKTLEEPNGDVVLILVTSQLMALPATIRSRCQTISFPIPNEMQAIQWLQTQSIDNQFLPLLLKLAHGAPLRVMDLIENDALSFRKKLFKEWYNYSMEKQALSSVCYAWKQHALPRVLTHLLSWTTDLIYLLQAKPNSIVNQDFQKKMVEITSKYDVKSLHTFYMKLQEAIRLDNSNINLNQQLLIEDLLIEWKNNIKVKLNVN